MTKREDLERVLANIVGEYEQSAAFHPSSSADYKHFERRSINAIVDALMEPSNSMLSKGIKCEHPKYGRIVIRPTEARLVWQAMLKDIINE